MRVFIIHCYRFPAPEAEKTSSLGCGVFMALEGAEVPGVVVSFKGFYGDFMMIHTGWGPILS